jgi:transcriptional regulator with XRE-family HTH domain
VNKLERYLKHNCITQRGFAKKIGTTPNNLGLLVKGKSSPSIRLAFKIEKATGGLVTLYDWVTELDKKAIETHLQTDIEEHIERKKKEEQISSVSWNVKI